MNLVMALVVLKSMPIPRILMVLVVAQPLHLPRVHQVLASGRLSTLTPRLHHRPEYSHSASVTHQPDRFVGEKVMYNYRLDFLPDPADSSRSTMVQSLPQNFKMAPSPTRRLATVPLTKRLRQPLAIPANWESSSRGSLRHSKPSKARPTGTTHRPPH
jgi:hypothetical protein